MQETETATFESLLASVDLRLGSAKRVTLARGGTLATAVNATSMIYVASGRLRGAPARSCALTPGAADHALAVAVGERSALDAGDAVLTLGRRPLSFEAETDAELIVSTLELTEAGARLHRLLPDPLVITNFDGLDPAVAALVRNMGAAEGECRMRSGDALLCRLMVQTAFLAVLRAWFTEGCAPRGWSARAADPQLDRVLTAIHSEPGRDWSLETLAGLGAMSRSVFARRFRELLGASPAHYVSEVRMETAKRRLETGASVSETSRELGYESDEGFRRAFRRHAGVAPSQWRDRALA
ncbi:AraC family transcriptional regulator [Leucobacter luti]|uniref:AraC-like DNA-binding protein n=1 Tax=Leucobacter luti TaxID=340320 RepID=A0A4Q7U4L6_9MICO|nr:AraC family transcriptional regulator [Leucobacter luti]MBL3700520.1 AraC family transcriptional regulator [Leucobacter luti]RZT68646.1 AraC-like DNA-binding protein [Leucobacter luti]